MGLRGPKPLPNVVKLMNGNPGKRPLNLSDGVNPAIQIPSPPKWLGTHAVKEWRRIGAELSELGLIAEIDKASLATYCQTWGDLCELEMAFAAHKKMARDRAPGNDLAIMAAYHYKTPTGLERGRQIYRDIVALRAELDRYVRNFGLNPAARARVQASSHIQPDLPGVESKEDVVRQGFARFAS